MSMFPEQQIREQLEEFRGSIYDSDSKIDKYESRRLEELAYRKAIEALRVLWGQKSSEGETIDD